MQFSYSFPFQSNDEIIWRQDRSIIFALQKICQNDMNIEQISKTLQFAFAIFTRFLSINKASGQNWSFLSEIKICLPLEEAFLLQKS